MSETELVEISIASDDMENSNIRRRGRDASGEDNSWQIPIETFTSQLKSDESLYKLKWKQKKFYKHQNEIIRYMLEAQEQAARGPDYEETDEEKQEAAGHELAKNIAVYGSLFCNIFLLILKV